MPDLTIHPLPTQTVDAYRAGALDAHGRPPERAVSGGTGFPCRHCLKLIPEGEEMLVLAHRPFETLHPYAEVGPIFLCAKSCTRHQGPGTPEVLTASPTYLVKAYTNDERIKYGTGQITDQDAVHAYAGELLEDASLAFVDVRSARNNCWLARVTRAQP